jgi:tetratricopeptide (TPR) repeat protein
VRSGVERSRIQFLRGIRLTRLPTILAVLATFLAAVGAVGAEAQLNRPAVSLIEISGGTGPQAWRLRYGTHSSLYQSELVPGEGDRAWFVHGNWLRLLDTKKGVVIGRWRFPCRILHLVPKGNQIEVEIEDRLGDAQVFRRALLFDPGDPHIPEWPMSALMWYRLPFTEVQVPWSAVSLSDIAATQKVTSKQAAQLLPQLEEAVKRDPLTPWLRVALGKVLWDIGDRRATAEFQQVVQITTTDFTELLNISALLEQLGEQGAARAVFERGYRDLLERGNDPRLNTGYWVRGSLYESRAGFWGSLPLEHRSELVERIYRVSPGAEMSETAWRLFAEYLAKNGRAEEAGVWRARADDANKNALFMWQGGLLDVAEKSALVVLACLVGAAAYFWVLYARYRPQRFLDVAKRRKAGEARDFGWLNTVYWGRRERLGFLLIVLAGWYAVGIAGQNMLGLLRFSSMPTSMSMGSYSGPATALYLENGLPATPERDLLRALAFQQNGENDKAERLYRSLPQFAESWNNLGVLLRYAGKDSEARQAFEKALQLEPHLAEAAFNLGRSPQGFWTEQHQKALPGRPMLAVPTRKILQGAFLGASPTGVYLRAVRGPLWEEAGYAFGSVLPISVTIAVLAVALAIVFLIPRREVTQPPGRMLALGETLFPGSSPGWGYLNGLVLAAWGFFLLQAFFMIRLGTPYFLTVDYMLNLNYVYGVPVTEADVLKYINPSWIWLYLAPAVLFAVNLVVVFREKLFRKAV